MMIHTKKTASIIAAALTAAAIIVCARIYYITQHTWTFAFYLNGNNNLLLEQQNNLREIIQGNTIFRHCRVVVYLDRGEGGAVPLMYSWKGARLFLINGNYQETLSHPVTPDLPFSIEKTRFRKFILKKINPAEKQLFQKYYIPGKERYHLSNDSPPDNDRTAIIKILHEIGYLPLTDTTQADSLSAEAMGRFFSFVRDNFESRHYAFFIAGHGQGWFSGMIQKDSSGKASIHRAPNFKVENIAKALKSNEPDVLSLDLCLMGDLESVYDLRKSAKYLVVSQGPLPARGQNYRDLLEMIHKQKPLKAESMARVIFSSSAESLKKGRLHGAVALVKAGPAIKKFSNTLINILQERQVQQMILSREKRLIRLPAWGPITSEMIDLDSLAAIINDNMKNTMLETESFILDRFSTSPKAAGLSIYYPLNETYFMLLSEHYSTLSFNRDLKAGWLEFLAWKFRYKNNQHH